MATFEPLWQELERAAPPSRGFENVALKELSIGYNMLALVGITKAYTHLFDTMLPLF